MDNTTNSEAGQTPVVAEPQQPQILTFESELNLIFSLNFSNLISHNFAVLKVVKELQQQHGLRHGDYQRYRGYCTRRISRLRKAINLPQGDKRGNFKKREVTLTHLEGKNSSEKFLHIPLMMAERAWAYAMQLRVEANSEPRKKFHLISKIRKACTYSQQLLELVESDMCDARTKLEAEAYHAWIKGTFYFEVSKWEEAAENLKKAQVVYESLMQALPEEEQLVYKAKVEELNPSLRYCAYNGGNASVDELLELRSQGILDNLGSLVAQTKSEQTDALQTTEWRGRKVTVRPQKVRLFLLSIQDLDASVEKVADEQNKIDLLENALMDCKDAISALKDEIKQDPKLRIPPTDGQVSGIQYLLSYLSFVRSNMTLQRNLCLVSQGKKNMEKVQATGNAADSKTTRPQDLSRLYEIMLQNVTEMKQLNGLENDSSYQREMDDLSLAFRAFRCFYNAMTLVNMKKWKEAVSMYERATKYANEAIANKLNKFNLKDDLKEMLNLVEKSKFSALAYSVLEVDTGADEMTTHSKNVKSSKPLFETLDKYKEDASLNSRNPNVYKISPEMEAIGCKPLFFDLALNFVEFPSLSDKIEISSKKSPVAGEGISGFVKGFLGWKK